MLNTTATVEGQHITFEKLTVYPTKTILDIKFDPRNSKQIFAFDDLRLLDENKHTWKWFSVTKESNDHLILHFKSNYFLNSKQLYLQAHSLRALDKDKLDVVVHLQKKQLLKSPDLRLQLDTIERYGKSAKIQFLLQADPTADRTRAYFPFSSEYHDQSGKLYENGGNFTSTTPNGLNQLQKIGVEIANSASNNDLETVVLYLVDYPTRIKGDINIKVK